MLLVVSMLPVRTPVASASGNTLDLSDPSQLSSFVDSYVRENMAANHVPGAVVVFVEDGKVLYEHGFGVADVAQGTPVDPEATEFRVASVSKILTTTAVMQLTDRSGVRLNADVNQYLKGFQVPATYSSPVTLSELLTHTAGFEEHTLGITTLKESELPSLETYLKTRMPARVTSPGSLFSYSNYSFALAGYVVQSVSGQSFDRYMSNQVFQPLGMTRTSFSQPLPASLSGTPATGYDVIDGKPSPDPYEYFADAPADAMSTTAADMGRFISFQLGDLPGENAVLSNAARTDMQQLHFQAVAGDDFDGMAYGYERYRRNGVLVLSKNGDVRGFSSYLSLLPDQHFGFFIAANTNSGGWMQGLERALIQRAFPQPSAASPVTPQSLRGSLAQFTGTYIPNRSSRTTIEKLRVLTEQYQVTDDGNGVLTVTYPNGGTVRLTRVAPLGFAYVSGGVLHKWPFLTGRGGTVSHFLIGNDTYNKVPWYARQSVQLVLVAAYVLWFLIGIGIWLGSAVLRVIRRRSSTDGASRHKRWLRGLPKHLGGAACLINLAFIVAVVAVLFSATATQDLDYSWLTYGTPTILFVLLCLPLISLAIAFALVTTAIFGVRARCWSWTQYGFSVFVLLSEAAFIPFLLYWNLLGFHVY